MIAPEQGFSAPNCGRYLRLSVFIQNLRRDHYQLGVDAAPVLRLATAVEELKLAI